MGRSPKFVIRFLLSNRPRELVQDAWPLWAPRRRWRGRTEHGLHVDNLCRGLRRVSGQIHRTEALLEADLKVEGVVWQGWFTSLSSDEHEEVLRIDLERMSEVRMLVRVVRKLH